VSAAAKTHSRSRFGPGGGPCRPGRASASAPAARRLARRFRTRLILREASGRLRSPVSLAFRILPVLAASPAAVPQLKPGELALLRVGGEGGEPVPVDVGEPGICYGVAGMQTLVDSVRATGVDNVIMLAGLNYAGDLTQRQRYESSGPGHNLV
jgi:hypothetical protein